MEFYYKYIRRKTYAWQMDPFSVQPSLNWCLSAIVWTFLEATLWRECSGSNFWDELDACLWQLCVDVYCIVQICKKICGLGCVTCSLVRAWFTQPSLHIFKHFCIRERSEVSKHAMGINCSRSKSMWRSDDTLKVHVCTCMSMWKGPYILKYSNHEQGNSWTSLNILSKIT